MSGTKKTGKDKASSTVESTDTSAAGAVDEHSQGEKAQAESDELEKAEARANSEAEEKAKLIAAQAQSTAAGKTQQPQTNNGDSNDGNEIPQDEISADDSGSDARVCPLLGAMQVRAKSADGFWRSGVQFHHNQEKLVLVVEQESDAPESVSAKDHKPECVVFLTPEKAKCVHDEPHLIVNVVELEDVLDLKDMQK